MNFNLIKISCFQFISIKKQKNFIIPNIISVMKDKLWKLKIILQTNIEIENIIHKILSRKKQNINMRAIQNKI